MHDLAKGLATKPARNPGGRQMYLIVAPAPECHPGFVGHMGIIQQKSHE